MIIIFFHSIARITVECTFGEIDICWRIFWKRINFSLDNIAFIMEGVIHLHNYLVHYREIFATEAETISDKELFRQDAIDT